MLKETFRPSTGTTVSIYNYSNTIYAHKQTISIICFLIANISLNSPKVINYSVIIYQNYVPPLYLFDRYVPLFLFSISLDFLHT